MSIRRRAGRLLAVAAAVVGLTIPMTTSASAAHVYFQLSQRINSGESFWSADGHLVMQGDGNLVLYCGTPAGKYLWDTATDGNPGAYAVFGGNGDLSVYTSTGIRVWSSGTAQRGVAYMRLQDDSNLVMYRDWQTPIWSTGTAGRC
ncbi:hypothetical protein OG875_05655 [Streptomyces sp. NBC_01498]|uniref:hypothetical protein n=1 Tax=Streptomyces sp. NBC_01498 TaxID=2975870 RepID=UPI002E7ADD90|nr:hypothetical protein [Streptomyces sp. NBC_01498]WTL24140.1 hypothetical protein OG875_05655 [Streptomyces sp. NBC_01498]